MLSYIQLCSMPVCNWKITFRMTPKELIYCNERHYNKFCVDSIFSALYKRSGKGDKGGKSSTEGSYKVKKKKKLTVNSVGSNSLAHFRICIKSGQI